MSKLVDLTGRRFNRLTVLGLASYSKRGYARWVCRCDCGVTKDFLGTNLKQGYSKSCGCLHRERVSRHGQYHSREYRSWESMKQRCLNPNHPHYSDYGGRGIQICARWMDFANFLADVGKRPPKTSLERIDVNKGYDPANCRWATQKEQIANRRVRRIENFSTDALIAELTRRGISVQVPYGVHS
jgi:hypothetical protein